MPIVGNSDANNVPGTQECVHQFRRHCVHGQRGNENRGGGGEEGGKYSSIAVKEERDVKKKKQRRSKESERDREGEWGYNGFL